MSWVVDTCVLIDILEEDPDFGRGSAACLRDHLSEGLLISPVSMIELSPAFEGNMAAQKEFLNLCGVDYEDDFVFKDVVHGHKAWRHYIRKKRLQHVAKRPIADIMIGAFALRFEGLITRNAKDFRPWFPELNLVEPHANSYSA